MQEETSDNIAHLLICFCTGRLTAEQRYTLLTRAASDQGIFDQLMEAEALRDALVSPEQRPLIEAAFSSRLMPILDDGRNVTIKDPVVLGQKVESEPGGKDPAALPADDFISEILEQEECPSVYSLAQLAWNNRRSANAPPTQQHFVSGICDRCTQLLRFLSGRNDSPDMWKESAAGLLSGRTLGASGGEEPMPQLSISQNVNTVGLRVFPNLRSAKPAVKVISLNALHEGSFVDIFILGEQSRSVNAPLVRDAWGVLTAELPLKLVVSTLESGPPVPFIARVTKAGFLHRAGRWLYSFLRRSRTRVEERSPTGAFEPSCAVIGDGNAGAAAAVGVVCAVKDSSLLLQISPQANLRGGCTLVVRRNDVSIGLAVIVRLEGLAAVGRFQAFEQELPKPQDLAILSVSDDM
ncbi:MAG: hypothetical protein WA324_11840 [Bryobacteraceae bacterium]